MLVEVGRKTQEKQMNVGNFMSNNDFLKVRELDEIEVGAHRSDVIKFWRADKCLYIYPLHTERNPSLKAFFCNEFEGLVNELDLIEIVSELGYEKVFELLMDGAGREIKVSDWMPFGVGGEYHSFPADQKWILYVSHDGVVAVDGILCHKLAERFPNLEKLEIRAEDYKNRLLGE